MVSESSEQASPVISAPSVVDARTSSNGLRAIAGFGVMAVMLIGVGILQSWSLSIAIINLSLVSAIMALGINVQWGYAGLFNVGIMGFAALGGVAAMLVSVEPVQGAWAAGGTGIGLSGLCVGITVLLMMAIRRAMAPGKGQRWLLFAVLLIGLVITRSVYLPSVEAIERFDPARSGFLGGLGLPILFSWFVGGLFAAAGAWMIGKVALGLRSDYLAIATLGISEIIIAIIKNEDWLTRGVKNVSGLPRPVPYEVALQRNPAFVEWVARFSDGGQEAVRGASSLVVKLSYTGLFLTVLLLFLWLARRAQRAPWGRMMRAIRDNETAANAMGKNVTRRHLQIFIIGSAIVGVAGAMLVTLEGQLTPGTYNPLRYTFLIWVMVIVGGSGNNLGAVLGAFIIWFFWVEAEPLGQLLIQTLTSGLDAENVLRIHMLQHASHMRLVLMGIVLLLVLRFSPKGVLPEQVRR